MASPLIDRTLPTVRSTPDIGKLNGMASPIVQVTKYTAKNSIGHAILPPTKMSVGEIIKLMTDIPGKWGAGTYHFKVNEEGGSDEDSWTVKLGMDPEAMGISGGEGGGSNMMNGVSVKNSEDFQGTQLAPGWWSVPSLGAVITPQGKMISWAQSPFAAQPQGVATEVRSTPIPQPGYVPGFESVMQLLAQQQNNGGNHKKDEGDRREIEGLKDMLRTQQEQQKDASFMRGLADLRDGFTKVVQDLASKTESRFEMLLNKMADKPAGPSETERLLLQQVEDMRRRESEQAREAALRNEFRSTMDALASKMDGNKTDPTMMMLTQIMSKAMEAGAATTQAIQAAAQSQAQTSERSAMMMADRLGGSIMGPVQMVEFLRMAKDQSGSAGIQKQMFDMFGDLMGMAKGLVRDHAEIAGAGSGPAWMPLAEQGVQTVGKLATILAQKSAMGQPQPQRMPMQQPMQMPPQQYPQRPLGAQVAPPGARPLTPGEQSDALAERIYGVEALKEKAPQAPRAAEAPQAVLVPQKQTPQDSFAVATQEAMQEATAQLSDLDFFGVVMADIEQMREQIENLTPEEIADGVFQAYTQLNGMGAQVPCMEVLRAGHVDLVVQRMVPDLEEESAQMIANAIRLKFGVVASAPAVGMAFPSPN